MTTNSKIIDLTHVINEKISVFPGTLTPKLAPLSTIEHDGFAELMLTMCTHTGTHIDAPSHMIKGAKSLDQFPVSKFTGKAIVISCQGRGKIDLEYLQLFENKISKVNYILFFTGWQQKWTSPSYLEKFPTLTQEAAEWLTRFNLDGLGFDAISVDEVSAINQPNHHILFEKEILVIENLTNLEQLPDNSFDFICLPLRIEHADGSPVRAIARV
jgi:arylformamidase